MSLRGRESGRARVAGNARRPGSDPDRGDTQGAQKYYPPAGANPELFLPRDVVEHFQDVQRIPPPVRALYVPGGAVLPPDVAEHFEEQIGRAKHLCGRDAGEREREITLLHSQLCPCHGFLSRTRLRCDAQDVAFVRAVGFRRAIDDLDRSAEPVLNREDPKICAKDVGVVL